MHLYTLTSDGWVRAQTPEGLPTDRKFWDSVRIVNISDSLWFIGIVIYFRDDTPIVVWSEGWICGTGSQRLFFF